MNKFDTYLSLEETEKLCRAYLNCQLSVMEEMELQYVLSKLPYSSPCISEVRMLMQVSLPSTISYSPKVSSKRFSLKSFFGIAASLTIVIGIGFALFNRNSVVEKGSDAVYIVYVDGQELTPAQSKEIVKSDMQRAEAFIRQMDELESQEKAEFENFINQIPSDL